MAYVATFTATRFSSIIGRMQKPFNSLLGDTYEIVTSKYRHITEQVSHHPPITAHHTESNFYETFTSCTTTMKFNGRYVSFQPQENIYICLKLPTGEKEYYKFGIPYTSVHNLIIGKIYVDI
jgi:hypothetical protein